MCLWIYETLTLGKHFPIKSHVVTVNNNGACQQLLFSFLLYVDRNFIRHPIKTSYSFIGDKCRYIVTLGHSFKNVNGKMSDFYIDFDFKNIFFIDKEMNTSFDEKHYLKNTTECYPHLHHLIKCYAKSPNIFNKQILWTAEESFLLVESLPNLLHTKTKHARL